MLAFNLHVSEPYLRISVSLMASFFTIELMSNSEQIDSYFGFLVHFGCVFKIRLQVCHIH